jgi:hypothetical protein
MRFNVKVIQLLLASIGVFLILITYFVVPEKFGKNIKEQKQIVEKNKDTIIIDSKEANLFDNVEYKGVYNINNFFTVKSKKAYILKEKPDEVYMTDMLVILNLNNGKVVNINSDKGIYNKINYNCYFENNVKATDGETLILSDNLDLLSDEDYASVYNNVILTSSRGSLSADKVNYDFENEVYKISMYNENLIKVKVTE